MRLNKWCITKLEDIVHKRKVICYGAGMVAHHIGYILKQYGILDNILFFVDKDPYKKNTQISLENLSFDIKPIDELYKQEYENVILLITCENYEDIVLQLKKDNKIYINDICAYTQLNNEIVREAIESDSASIMDEMYQPVMEYLIPANIHYCWFGNSEIPEEHKEYIAYWKQRCPEYKFYYWNESNYDINQCQYIKEAYESRHYAFVTDYVRMDVVYRYGGIYLDTDVELLKSFDSLRRYRAFFTYGRWPAVNSGSGFGATKGNKIIKEMRDNPRSYIHFKLSNGRYNKTTNCLYESEILKKYGFKMDFSTQIINDVKILSPKYFPSSLYLKENCIPNTAIALHKDAGSWK